MNEKLLRQAFDMLKKSGYEGEFEDYKKDIQENEEIFNISKKLVGFEEENLGKTQGVVEMDATVTPIPEASTNMDLNLEDFSLELKQDELTSLQSVKNSLINFGEQLYDVVEFWGNPKGDGSGSRAALNIATNTINAFLYGQEEVDAYVKSLDPQSSKAKALGTKNTLESIKKLEQERSQTLQTKGILESAKKGDIGGVLAGSINGITNAIGSIGYLFGTAGTGFFMDYVADNYVAFNKLKAENLGKDLKTLIQEGEADTAIPITMGAISQGLEMVGFGAISRGVGKAFSGKGGGGLTAGLSTRLAEKLIYNKRARAIANVLSTGTTEMSTEMLQHVSDKINENLGDVAGTDLDKNQLSIVAKTFVNEIFSEESIESGLQGFVGGGGIPAGTYSAKAMSTVRSFVDGEQLEEDFNNISVLRRNLKDAKDETVKKGIQLKINEIDSRIADNIVKSNKVYKSLDDETVRELDNLYDLRQAAAFNITELNKKIRRGEITEDQYVLAKKGFDAEFSSIKNKIIDMNLTKNLEVAEKEATKKGLKFNRFKTTEEFEKAVEKSKSVSEKTKKSMQQYKSEDGVIHGFHIGNEIFIDEEASKKVGAINVGLHELLHPILNKLIGDSEKQGRYVKDFKRSMTSAQRRFMEKKMKDNYTPDEYNTEYINVFADSIRKKEINYDKSVFEKIGDVVLSIFRPIGYDNISFDDGRAVFNFIKEYDKTSDTGALTEAAAAAIGEDKLALNKEDLKKQKESFSKTKQTAKPGETIVYNASPKPFDELGERTGLTFLATDIKEAKEYARNNAGDVKEIIVENSSLATQEQVLNKLKELNVDISEGLLYEMIDPRFDDYYIGKQKVDQLKKELAKQGFKGFKYKDGSQLSNKETESIAVFDKSSIKLNENIYEELRLIDEFEADFKPTKQSTDRKKELLDIINEEEEKEIINFSKNKEASEEVQRLFNEKPRDWEVEVIKQMRPITAKLVERRKDVTGFDRQILIDEIETGERGILDLIRSYDPKKNDSLAAYINTFLSFRAQEGSKRVLKEVFESDVTEERSVAAQEDDISIEEAVDESIKPTQEQKSKLRRQIRLPDEQVEKVRQAVRKTFGTKLPPPDSPKFKKALRKAFDTELFKELKTNVFKARDDYKFFMSQNWKALYDAIPQETLNQSFAPFREPVLDETGKQKREKTPEGERIFKKKNITKEEFLDYFFSPDLGVSTRGTRKDAIVRMAAQELGFDATMETIKEPKVAEKIEFANPEIKTPELSETIDRDQDLQFSKEAAKSFAKNKYNFYEFKVDGDYKKSVNRFINDIKKLISLGVFPNSMLNKSMLNGIARLYFKGKNVKNKEAKKQYLTEKLDSLEKSFKEGSSNIEDISSYSAKGKAGGTFGTDLESEKWKNLTKDNGKAVKEFNQKRGDLFDTFWNSLNNFINDSSLTKEQRKKRIEDFGSTIYYILQASDAERSHPHSAGAKIVGFVKNLSESFRVDVENRDTKKIKKLLSITWEHAVPNKFAYESLLNAMYKGDKAFNEEFRKIKNNFTVIAIPKIVDKLLNQINKSGMPVNWNSWTDRYTIKELKEALKKAGIKFDFVEDIQPAEDQVISWSNPDVAFAKSKQKTINKKLDKEFNKILENSTSIAASDTISEAKGRLAGERKNKFRFFIPPSADDLVGLLYYTLGKGKIGDAQLKWYNQNIISPFAQAMEAVSRDRNETARRFNKIVKDLGIIPKNLRKEIPGDIFTIEQAIRVYIWNKQGMKIPGLSKADEKKLLKYIEENSKLKNFGDKLISVNRGYDYAKPGEGWLTGTITSDLKETLNTTKRAAYLDQWQKNVDTIFSKKNLNKLEAAYGRQYRLAVENILQRMKTGRNRDFAGDKLTTRFVDWINGSVGAIMFFNTRSAILQTLSAVNFINFSDNNIFAAAKAFANQKQYWSDFKMLFNSDFLVDRRQGLRMDINEADLATAAKQGGTRGIISKLLKLGFTPTQIADSFAIAAGGSTFYRNRLNSLMKDGMDKKAAEKITFQEFRETAEESQQSSRPDKISQQQAGPLGRIILAFANTPSQYARITKKAFLDLKNGRGDAKTNISKIVYYTFVQNLIFNAAQQALFALAFSDEDDEEFENKKIARVANGMADSVLRGLGFGGAIASTIKNLAIKLEQRSKKKNPEYQDAMLDIFKISPPISSKITKLRSAARAYDWNKEEIKTEGISIDNPAALALGELTSAVTNVPLDRAIRKIQNVDASITDDLDFYQRLALLGGWSKWDLGIEKTKKQNKYLKRTYSKRTYSKKDK